MLMTQAFKRRLGRALVAATLLGLAACGSSRTMVMEAPSTDNTYQGLRVVEGDSLVQVPTEARSEIKEYLNEEIYSEQKLPAGDDLTLTYRVIQFDAGNQFTRWFLGGIGNAGEGSLMLHVTFTDNSGIKRGEIQAEAKIGSGFFGGDFSSALARVAEEVTEYTVANFRFRRG